MAKVAATYGPGVNGGRVVIYGQVGAGGYAAGGGSAVVRRTPGTVGQESYADVTLPDGWSVRVRTGHGQPPGVKQVGDSQVMRALQAADPSSELYYDRDSDISWWNVLHAPDKLSFVVAALSACNWELGGCAFYAREAPVQRDCVVCTYATASVGDRCRYCAGQMPCGLRP